MKKILTTIVLCLMTLVTFAQADMIVGNYKAVRGGVESKVKVYKHADGYRAQVYWVDNLKKKDGTLRTDEKNPNKAKRATRADQIILIDKVTYNATEKVWENGQIYDPTSGKVYKCKISFKDNKTLQVRGYLGPFYQSMYWNKL